jgi:aspartyl/asparaginyl beta-hydroxylase (cupin superfamily)
MKPFKKKLWFRTSGLAYVGKEPAFFNPADFDWAKYIMSNWQTIRDEMQPIIDEKTNSILRPYFEEGVQYPPKNWKTESFYFWSRANRPMIKMFPKTHAIIKEVPGLVSASINLLEPGSKINAHYGDTNAIYRCHLGLKIPKALPQCGFKVKNEERAWEEGNFLIFLDAYTHEAFNYSNDKRYILLIDVLRPEFKSKKYLICSQVLGATALYNITNKLGLRDTFEDMPGYIRRFCVLFTQSYSWLFFTMQRIVFSTHLK